MQIHHIFAFLLLSQSFFACQPVQEQVQSLAASSIGLSCQTADPQDSAKVRPMAANAVFQSMDGGRTWQDASAGLPDKLQVQGVFSSGNDVFVTSGNALYRRSNASIAPAWEQILVLGTINAVAPGQKGLYASSYERGLFQNVPGTIVWENRSKTLKDKSVRTVLETPDGAVLVGTDSGIFKSVDGGENWKQVFSKGMVLDLVASGDVLIGGGTQGVLRSTDGGEHWDNVLNENIMAKKTARLKDHFVAILGTEDPQKPNPDGITSRLRASADGGKTWKRLEQPLFPLQTYDMDVSLLPALDIYDIVQLGENLFCSFDTGVFRSSDQGKTWERVFGKSGFNLAVSGGVIYAVPGGGC